MKYIIVSNGELYHHGIKGMKWGVRRFQNSDGTRTAAGRKRYTDSGEKKPLSDEERAARNAKIKKAAIAVGAAAATAALAYAGHKYMSQVRKTADHELAQKVVAQKGKYFSEMWMLDERSREANDEGAYQRARELQHLAAEKAKNRKTFEKLVDKSAKKGSVRRAAQRAVIKRDVSNTASRVHTNLQRRKLHSQHRSLDALRQNLKNDATIAANDKKMREQIDTILRRGYTSKRNW